jgi:hypothetical protein
MVDWIATGFEIQMDGMRPVVCRKVKQSRREWVRCSTGFEDLIVSSSLAQNPGGKALRVFSCPEFAEIVKAHAISGNVAASVYQQQIDSKPRSPHHVNFVNIVGLQ